MIEFEIRELPKPYNASERENRWVRRNDAARWKKMVAWGVIGRVPPAPLRKARLTLTRHSSVCPDFDGLAISFKHVVDGLVEAGVIEDDSMDHIGMPTFLWKKAPPKQGKITVRVDSVDPTLIP